jgi:intraflagellar transport protein 122
MICFAARSNIFTGGGDNIVIIWKSSGQGLLKYSHASPIQCVKYNPTMLLLASCSDVRHKSSVFYLVFKHIFCQADFGLWTPDQKQVTKEKMPSRILSAAWSSDGSMLALGMLSGQISVRNQQAEEIVRFERKAPIWCLAFIPDFAPPVAKPANGVVAGAPIPGTDITDILAVGCWDKTYSLYR